MNWRLRVIQSFFWLFVFVIALRLGYWQVIKAADLSEQATYQRQTVLEIPSPRGEIKSSDGFPLATNQQAYLMYVNPRLFSFSSKLAELLPASESARLQQTSSYPNLYWFLISRRLSASLKDKITSLSLPGVGFESDPVRFYPEASISAQLVGFVGQDTAGQPKGYFGLEGFYGRQLTGKPGRLIHEQDALNRPILISDQNLISPQAGSVLTTSINRVLQFIAYRKLSQGITRYQAVSGTVTIMEPATGRILVMASLPSYDPHKYQTADPSFFKNPIVSESYEPGSTFKIFAMAAALDSKAVKPDTKCPICSGPVSVSGYTIKTWNEKYYSESTMTEVIQHSDNVGMAWVGQKLGKTKFIDYLSKFGFGKETGIDLQEESSPTLRPAPTWVDIDLATAAFGQGIATTPLQVVRAASAIANHGLLPKPQVVDKINDKVISPAAPVQVISAATAAQVTQMMVNAVDLGEAKWAKPAGISIAGKTGTAQIPVSGHYDDKKTIVSFIGFAPPDNPKFVMLVTLREPKTSPWGSETAAPLWFDIARDALRLLK